MNPALVAPIAVAALGALAMVLASWLTMRGQRDNTRSAVDSAATAARIADGTATRKELWDRIEKLEARNDRLAEQLEAEREDHSRTREENGTLKAQLLITRAAQCSHETRPGAESAA